MTLSLKVNEVFYCSCYCHDRPKSFKGQKCEIYEKIWFEKDFYTNAGKRWKTLRFKLMLKNKFLMLDCVYSKKRLDNQAQTWLIITINDTSIGDLPLIITISDTCKNQPKRLDFDNTINLSSLIVSLVFWWRNGCRPWSQTTGGRVWEHCRKCPSKGSRTLQINISPTSGLLEHHRVGESEALVFLFVVWSVHTDMSCQACGIIYFHC
jgi:hypothetical protein